MWVWVMSLVGRPPISWSKRVHIALFCAGISYVVFLPDSIAQIEEPIDEHPSDTRSTDLALVLQPKLVYESGDSTRGVAGQYVQEPLRVKVTDEFDQPVPNYKVHFSVIRGGGSIDDSLEVQRLTDAEGLVSVTPRLGTSVGWYTNVFTARAYGGTGQEIVGSPIDFHISGRKSRAALLEYVSGDGQSARAGQTLPDPLQVRVRDDDGNALIGHDVTFRVFQGGGSLGSEKESSLTITSGAGGIAQVLFHLGPEIGTNNHIVKAFSDDGLEDLTGSPQLFYASAPYGQPDLISSRVIVTNSPVVADNVDEAVILIRLRDMEQNPITGEQVTISVTGSDNTVVQPQNLTDQNGETTARARSIKAERKTVTARIAILGIDLTEEIPAFRKGGRA